LFMKLYLGRKGEIVVTDDSLSIIEYTDGFNPVRTSGVERINANPDNVDQGLAKLVLTVIELLRRIMEHEALRRIDGQTLTDEEIEHMGETFLKLDIKMEEMRELFGLKPEDLNIDLGPLGNLM